MKTRLKILLFVITSSVFSFSKQNKLKSNNCKSIPMSGEWKTTCSDDIKDDRILIIQNYKYYKFSKKNGGSLLDSGIISNDTFISYIFNNYKEKFFSNNCKIFLKEENNLFNTLVEYKKIDETNQNLKLNNYLYQDSIRKLLIGWWKLDLLNSIFYSNNQFDIESSFTININKEGDAIKYLNNKYDEYERYRFQTTINGVQFQIGCLVSDHKIIDINDKLLVITWNRESDTLYFNRLKEIK